VQRRLRAQRVAAPGGLDAALPEQPRQQFGANDPRLVQLILGFRLAVGVTQHEDDHRILHGSAVACCTFRNSAAIGACPGCAASIYPSAMHAFDAPNLPRTELPACRIGNGPVPAIGTDTEASADAFPRVLEFLKRHLQSN
jgi:hypothetical protein